MDQRVGVPDAREIKGNGKIFPYVLLMEVKLTGMGLGCGMLDYS